MLKKEIFVIDYSYPKSFSGTYGGWIVPSSDTHTYRFLKHLCLLTCIIVVLLYNNFFPLLMYYMDWVMVMEAKNRISFFSF
jgi:hypothetical protein